MAMNNPYPWVSSAVAAANGYNTGGGGDAANTGFDPTNPGRRNRRPVASGDGGGIPATPPVVAPTQASTAVNASAQPWRSPVSILAENWRRNNTASGIDPFGNKIQTDDEAKRAQGIPTTPPVMPAVGASASTTAPTPAGQLPATPPSVPMPPTPPAANAAAGQNQTATANGKTFNWNTTPDRLVGLGAAPPVSPNALVDQGVTLPDGRKLPYGAMVNGVPTFSDGSGGIGARPPSIPRTMTQSDIAGLGARLPTVPAGTAPVGFADSAAFNSPDSEANIANIMRSNQTGKFGVTPEMNAQATLAAVSNRDPRNTLGRAALNLERNAAGATTVMQRKAALGALGGLDEGAVRDYLATTSGVNSLADINAQGANALQRTKVAEQQALIAQEARREQQLQNTNLAGQFRLQAAQMRDAPKATTAKDQVSLALNLWQKAPQLLGLDPMGNIADPTTGKLRAPTPQERSALWSRALQMVSTGPGAGAQGLGATPPTAATSMGPTAGEGTSGAGTSTGGATARPTTKAAFDALPSGSLYVNPSDGKTYRKN